MTTKRWTIISLIAFLILVSAVYYKQTHLSIWGFNLPKKDLKDVIVQTEKHSYIVTDKELVLKIAEDVSKMKKYSKIESLPPETKPEQYKKLLIRTKGNTTYGGSIWVMENNVLIDSNNYYWDIDYNKLSNTLNTSLKNATLANSLEN
jgi:Ser-tRNA(Ala) deacylase AlaX